MNDAASPVQNSHTVEYCSSIPTDASPIDLVIVATTSFSRRAAVEKILSTAPVRHFILEKLLFHRAADYGAVASMLARCGSAAWVNCAMRVRPLYAALKDPVRGRPLGYCVTGSHVGLATSAIHYVDHMAYLTGCSECSTVDTEQLTGVAPSRKRPEFLEVTGTLRVQLTDGSSGTFTSYAEGEAPILIVITNSEMRCVVRESEQRASLATAAANWTWSDVEAPIHLQSQMTRHLAESILRTGTCSLTPYEESMGLHLALLGPLLTFVNKMGPKDYDYYPFT
jgi:hypothetical protein